MEMVRLRSILTASLQAVCYSSLKEQYFQNVEVVGGNPKERKLLNSLFPEKIKFEKTQN